MSGRLNGNSYGAKINLSGQAVATAARANLVRSRTPGPFNRRDERREMTDGGPFSERYMRIADLAERIEALAHDPARWTLIREIYKEVIHDIEEAEKVGSGVDPYFVDWMKVFTPVEEDAWQSIRGQGLRFYPQFPVLSYFIDFADPIKKIGLEIDGRDWHTNRDKDRARDLELLSAGWRIFRVTGAEAYACPRPPWDCANGGDADERHVWMFRSVDGLVYALLQVYYRNNPDAMDGDCLRALDRHRLVNFDLFD